MDVSPLSNDDLGMGSDPGWDEQAPLWFYLLGEAAHQHDSAHLGDVDGRIVGEVLLGLLDADKTSFVNQGRGFRPEPPIAPEEGRFEMADLIRFAEGDT